MSELSLLLIHDDYVQAIASLKRIESGLESMTNTKDSVADAVGHSGLAGAYRDFNEDWRAGLRRAWARDGYRVRTVFPDRDQ